MSLAISGTLALGSDASYDARLPRFAFDSHFIDGAVSVSSEQALHPREQASDGFTDTAWIGAVGDGEWWIELSKPGAKANFCGLLLFGDNPRNAPSGLTVRVQSSVDGVTWTDVADPIMPTERVSGFLFDSVTHDFWRVLFTADEPPRVAEVTLCEVLVAENGIAAPFNPPKQARNNEIMNNSTDSGHHVGRSRINKGISTQFSISTVSEEWVRDDWERLVDHAETRPFYCIWSPVKWAKEIAFVWSDGDIPQPRYTNNAGWMDVSMKVKGFAG